MSRASLLLVLGGALACTTTAAIFIPRADPWQPPVAPAQAREVAPRVECASRDPLRRAFFGDLHVHTAYSFDARSRDMLGTADDAYRFARGEPIGLGPFGAQGQGSRTAQLAQPLDFAAVTDHAEWIGEVSLCTRPGSPAYDAAGCRGYRGEGPVQSPLPTVQGESRLFGVLGIERRRAEICGPGSAWCRQELADAWLATREVTERWYDRSSDCAFTTFHGWEHSYSPGQSKVHRNVIFRNEIVPELPVSSLEQPDAIGLWDDLDRLCNRNGSGCEAITIPHNPNMANGRLFTVSYRNESADEQRRQASVRARFEPLVEMMQVKGESECKNGLFDVVGEDELCDFEKVRGVGPRFPDCREGIGTGAMAGHGCESRLDYARYALIEGMRERERIGVNPYAFGLIGATDTHNATPGDVDEDGFQGCCANVDTTPQGRLDPGPSFAGASRAHRNPGGLMGVWAEANTRDDLFDAMRRRETFATSGPRIQPRLFGGWDLPPDACVGGDPIGTGYMTGVPMGGVLSARPDPGASPTFLLAATRDPRGGLLQRLQIVKVWADDDGRFHQAVHDVAGDAGNGAEVDLGSCEPRGSGHDELCSVWRDPDFEPGRDAAYYLRVVENPSCRWSWHECLRLAPDQRPSTCSDPEVPRVIQERAWSSPIWYAPQR